jgi:hypothetical protein
MRTFLRERFTHVSKPLAAIIALSALSSSASAVIFFVDASAPNGGDGDFWSTAFNKIQDAITLAGVGDQVWVKAGVYHPTLQTGIDVESKTFKMKEGVSLYGGFDGTEPETTAGFNQRDPYANATYLDGTSRAADERLARGDRRRPRNRQRHGARRIHHPGRLGRR